jgi:anti-sigma B factor antagonist
MTEAEPYRTSGFTVSPYRAGEAVVLRVSGELDIVTAPTLATYLDIALTSAPSVVIVDLIGVDFISSAAFTLLVETHRLTERTTTSLRVAADGPATSRPLQVSGVDQIIDLYPSVAAAMRGRDS